MKQIVPTEIYAMLFLIVCTEIAVQALWGVSLVQAFPATGTTTSNEQKLWDINTSVTAGNSC